MKSSLWMLKAKKIAVNSRDVLHGLPEPIDLLAYFVRVLSTAGAKRCAKRKQHVGSLETLLLVILMQRIRNFEDVVNIIFFRKRDASLS